MTVHKLWPLFVVMIMFSSCGNSSDTLEMKSVNSAWSKKAEQNFSFQIADAQNAKNIIFVIRNNNEYPYSNIRFIVKLKDGKQVTETDTLNYILAQPDGTWLGKGFGDTKEIMFQYKLNYIFPKNGAYNIGITQAMRADTLKGIEDIGVKIETPKP